MSKCLNLYIEYPLSARNPFQTVTVILCTSGMGSSEIPSGLPNYWINKILNFVLLFGFPDITSTCFSMTYGKRRRTILWKCAWLYFTWRYIFLFVSSYLKPSGSEDVLWNINKNITLKLRLPAVMISIYSKKFLFTLAVVTALMSKKSKLIFCQFEYIVKLCCYVLCTQNVGSGTQNRERIADK